MANTSRSQSNKEVKQNSKIVWLQIQKKIIRNPNNIENNNPSNHIK